MTTPEAHRRNAEAAPEAAHLPPQAPGAQAMRRVILLLAGSVALVMTGYGIIMPVFGRRLETFGSGVQDLGLMTMGFALAQFALSPVIGSIADRIGRRPIILVGLGGFGLVNLGFIFAPNTHALMALRVLEGAVTAGLFPAALGVVGDIVPEAQRARWTGILMGSYGFGFTVGPFAGGTLYDALGFEWPFIASAGLALLAVFVALRVLPETHTTEVRRRLRLAREGSPKESLLASLPRPLWVFGSLLLMDFVLVFSFTFVEPEMVFYAYRELKLTTAEFGLIITFYGLALVAGQFTLAGLGDRMGRRAVIVGGLLINAVFYLGLLFTTSLPVLLIVSVVSGIGEAIAMPALAAIYLDMSDERHRSRIMGIRASTSSLATVAGPLLVALISSFTTSRVIFSIGMAAGVAAGLLGLFSLRRQARVAREVRKGNEGSGSPA